MLLKVIIVNMKYLHKGKNVWENNMWTFSLMFPQTLDDSFDFFWNVQMECGF